MKKSHAFELLGGTAADVARACRITPSAVSQWPDELTKDQVDRVQAALWRLHHLPSGEACNEAHEVARSA
jgi:hypothetical protein